MKVKITPAGQARINQMIDSLKNEFSSGVVAMLKDANRAHLNGKGKVTLSPVVDSMSIRWMLVWNEGKVSFELNIVVTMMDDGAQARVDRVWVHRHVTTPFDFDGNTPSTHMHRLTGLNLPEIRAAVESEFG